MVFNLRFTEDFISSGDPAIPPRIAIPGATLSVPVERTPYSACPLCNSENLIAFLEADCTRHALWHERLPKTQRWLECDTCAHVFTDGYFDGDALAALFLKTHENQTAGADFERQRFVAADIIDKVSAVLGRQSGCWLDVGFGNGALMATADEYGFTPYGLDLRESNVSAIRKLGFDADCCSLGKFQTDTHFSVISMADVLEHEPFPKETLRRARELIIKMGVVFVSMPNASSFVWQQLSKARANPYWGEIEHFHNFTRERLYMLLEECGFAPFHYSVSRRYRACMEVMARPV